MFRATQLGITSQAINFNQAHFSAIAQLQKQLSSGLRFERVSEAPLEAGRVQSLTETLRNLRSDQAQLPEAERILNQSVSSLLEIEDIANRAKQISLDAFQQNDEEGSKILADEVDGLINRLKLLAATNVSGQYLFSGTQTKQKPIEFSEHDGLPIPVVRYVGGEDRSSIGVSTSVNVDTRFPASEFLFTRDRGATLVIGETGAAAGSGVDSGVGTAFLDVVHTNTIYFGASGVHAGTTSDTNDTIIGPRGGHLLQIDDTSGTGAFGTVSLNGGQVFDFISTDTDLEVIGPSGEKVFIDTTSIAAGFSGVVEIESRGTISTDGGASSRRIDFEVNQVLRNEYTGQVTHIDTTNITKVGRDHLEYVGTSDLFTALYELKNDLLNTRTLGSEERNAALNRRADDIARSAEQVLTTVGLQSVSLQSLDSLRQRQLDQELELELTISDIQSVDLARAATELQNRQTLVQANFASISIVQNLSVLNFLG